LLKYVILVQKTAPHDSNFFPVQLRHPKVISFLGASFDGEDKVIVMEYMKYGSVYDALRRPDTRQNILEAPPTQLRIALDIAQGMSYLHSKDVLHRDLTSKNILLDAYLTAKVSDLGLSKIKSDAVQLSGTFGVRLPRYQHPQSLHELNSLLFQAIPWQAPEVLNGNEFTLSADVYSFGCILVRLRRLNIPFRIDINPILNYSGKSSRPAI
jgi:serine/threonine protein kinase